MTGIVNRNEWRVIGMSRSGNHAIIHWILAHAEGRTCFLNCAEPKNNPFCWARPLGTGQPCYRVNYPEFDLERERAGTFSTKDYLVYSYEDCFLGMFRDGPWEDEHDAWLGPSASRRDILILRDPFNLFASRLKTGIGTIPPHTAIRIWKQHARQFLGLRRLLRNSAILISYNQWVSRRSYRRRLAKQLGLRFTDSGIDEVSGTAGGSSFDGMEFRRRASRMKVFDRWKLLADDEAYRRLFDEETIRLSEAIFGPSPAAERLGFCSTEPPRGRSRSRQSVATTREQV
jgi:hypothetical protein